MEYTQLVWPSPGEKRGVHRAPPKLWPQPGGEEVRGPTSVEVHIDWMGTASVAPVMALLVPGVEKPPRWVGKRFIRFIADIQRVLNVPKDLLGQAG